MLARLISDSRRVLLVAVFGTLVACLTLLGIGLYKVVMLLVGLLAGGHGRESKVVLLGMIEAADTFLLATVFYVIALGLYELFVGEGVRLPEWLEIHDLDDLKAKLLSVIVVYLGVLFLGEAVKWNGDGDILPFGLAIAAVIAAITYFLRQKARKGNGDDKGGVGF